MSAYLATPKKGKGPGVVVIQEIFGVTDSLKAFCNHLADRQFTALCPDLYWRENLAQPISESDFETARGIRMKLDDNQVVADIASAMKFLSGHETCTGKVAVVGFCWGGLLAFLTATKENPAAAVSYYGVGIEKHLAGAKRNCNLMLHYGGKDKFAPPEAVAQVRDSFKGDKRVQIFEYPEADHAFARDGGHNYHHPSADLANMRTVSFLVDRLFGGRND